MALDKRRDNLVTTSVDNDTLEFLNRLSTYENATRSAILRAMILTFKEEYEDAEFEQAEG